MKRISQIEGLRAYLAIWVVLDHVISLSGYDAGQLSGITKALRSGWYAVDVFIIISGFVIFYLLDHKRESYKAYIARRFFRLWPLFFFLFLVAIPVSILSLDNFNQVQTLFPHSVVGDGVTASRIASWWEHLGTHLLLHIPMLHGTVPDSLLPYAPSAFLGPAWSISLEMQFYLIAPLVFAYVTSGRRYSGIITSAIVLVIFLLSERLPKVQSGAFLPMHIEYFYVGCLSYFGYKAATNHGLNFSLFPLATALAVLLFVLSGNQLNLLPICIWIVFYSLLLDTIDSSRRTYATYASWLFENQTAQYLGKISYSIYLVHSVVIAFAQGLILYAMPTLSQQEHLGALAVTTCIATVGAAHFLFRFIERPGIQLGNRVAAAVDTSR